MRSLNLLNLTDMVVEFLKYEGELASHSHSHSPTHNQEGDNGLETASKVRKAILQGHITRAIQLIGSTKSGLSILGDSCFFSLLIQLFIEAFDGNDDCPAAWLGSDADDTGNAISWVMRSFENRRDRQCPDCGGEMGFNSLVGMFVCNNDEECDGLLPADTSDGYNSRDGAAMDKYKRKASLCFVRNILAPELSRLKSTNPDAYKTCYASFKTAMLVIIDPDHSPLLSRRHRESLASEVNSHMVAAIGGEEPMFGVCLRYLTTVHNLHCALSGMVVPDQHIIDSLILPDLIDDVHVYGRHANENASTAFTTPPVIPTERDILTLAQAVSVPRYEAIRALQRVNGDLNQALKVELRRIQLDKAVLLPLLREVVEHEGISGASSRDSSRNGERENANASSVALIRRMMTEGKWEEAMEMVETVIPGLLDSDTDMKFMALCGRVQASNETLSEKIKFIRTHITPLTLELKGTGKSKGKGKGGESERRRLLLRKLMASQIEIEMKNHDNDSDNGHSQSQRDPSCELKLRIDEIIHGIIIKIESALGKQDPVFIRVMEVLLQSHIDFFKNTRMSDPFEKVCGVDLLKATSTDLHLRFNGDEDGDGDGDGEVTANTDANVTSSASNAGANSSMSTGGGMSADALDDNAIDTLCEAMGMSRDEAIDILIAHEGDINAVFATMFA